jgi:hypothetical protein
MESQCLYSAARTWNKRNKQKKEGEEMSESIWWGALAGVVFWTIVFGFYFWGYCDGYKEGIKK